MGADYTHAEALALRVIDLEREEIEINKKLKELQLKLNEKVPKNRQVKVKDNLDPIYDITEIDPEEFINLPPALQKHYYNKQKNKFYLEEDETETKQNNKVLRVDELELDSDKYSYEESPGINSEDKPDDHSDKDGIPIRVRYEDIYS